MEYPSWHHLYLLMATKQPNGFDEMYKNTILVYILVYIVVYFGIYIPDASLAHISKSIHTHTKHIQV